MSSSDGHVPAPARQPSGFVPLSELSPAFQATPVICPKYVETWRAKLEHYMAPLPPLAVRQFCFGKVDKFEVQQRQGKPHEIGFLRWQNGDVVYQIYFARRDATHLERLIQSGANARTIIQMNHTSTPGEQNVKERDLTVGREIVFVRTETHLGGKARHWVFRNEYDEFLKESYAWHTQRQIKILSAPIVRVKKDGAVCWAGNNLESDSLRQIIRSAVDSRKSLKFLVSQVNYNPETGSRDEGEFEAVKTPIDSIDSLREWIANGHEHACAAPALEALPDSPVPATE